MNKVKRLLYSIPPVAILSSLLQALSLLMILYALDCQIKVNKYQDEEIMMLQKEIFSLQDVIKTQHELDKKIVGFIKERFNNEPDSIPR